MKNFRCEIISCVPTQKEIQFLDDMIYEHNVAETNRDDGKLFSKWIHDSNRNIVAGITGWTWASACEVTLFWVKGDCRNKGYGTALLNAAETEAKTEKCKTIFLRTYSFQAPEFYYKHGYIVEYEIKDFPPGHGSLCLIKRLELPGII
jgi:GNAT superfamily N-acetyltransferase